MDLYVGGNSGSIQGDPYVLDGLRMLSPVHGPPPGTAASAARTRAIIDSGAFSDPPDGRLSPAGALERQLTFEERCRVKWGAPDWMADALVSYDWLIDETWVDGVRSKGRWSEDAARDAVDETVRAARFLAGQRGRVAPRGLVLAVQGVTADQYVDCADRVLAYAEPGDVLGLGGWCILGLWKSWMPEFWRAMRQVIPRAKLRGIDRVHLFGVLYLPALGALAWLCDRYGVRASTDSTRPVLDVTRTQPGRNKAGVRADGWRDNVAWWQGALAGIRDTNHYRAYPEQLRLLG